MLEPANREAPGARKLVLGFDGGCTMCSDVAERISERVGDKLEVRSLYHPQVEYWREQALGKDAPWAPTLFEIGGAREVRAWTGLRMAVRLARALGPVSTWRVMQALVQVQPSRARSSMTLATNTDANGLSRGQFFRNMGGAALAASVLSSTGVSISEAHAAQRDARAAAQAKKMREEAAKIRRAVSTMEKHMRIEEDGTLRLDEKGLSNDIRTGSAEGIESEVFDDLKKDLEATNTQIRGGKLRAAEVFPSEDVELVEQKISARDARSCRGRSGRKWYWWGVRLYLNSCDVNKLLLVYAGYLSASALCDKFPFTTVPCKFIRAALTFSAGYIHYVHAQGGSDGLVIQKSYFRYLPKIYSQ